jgi:hypothetical protein
VICHCGSTAYDTHGLDDGLHVSHELGFHPYKYVGDWALAQSTALVVTFGVLLLESPCVRKELIHLHDLQL